MNFLKNWDFKKHAKFVSAFYLICYAIDMTLGFLLVKKLIDEDGKPKKITK